MIRPAKGVEDIKYVTQKFKETNRFGLNEKDFFAHINQGIKSDTCGVYISSEGEEINGCIVVSIVVPSMVATPLLWIDFIYSEKPEVTRALANAVHNLAKFHKIGKISGSMKRGSEAIIKRYGYKEDYIVISKEVT